MLPIYDRIARQEFVPRLTEAEEAEVAAQSTPTARDLKKWELMEIAVERAEVYFRDEALRALGFHQYPRREAIWEWAREEKAGEGYATIVGFLERLRKVVWGY